MPKANKVDDINKVTGLIPTVKVHEPLVLLEKKTFWQRLGLSNIIPSSEEKEEFKRHPLKYLYEKLVVDSNEAYFYYWCAIVSIVYVYNLIVSSEITSYLKLTLGRDCSKRLQRFGWRTSMAFVVGSGHWK